LWRNIIKKCTNPKAPGYKSYGGRGIGIYSLWRNDYDEFADWALQAGYEEGKTVILENVDADFGPANCIIADMNDLQSGRISQEPGRMLRYHRRPVINATTGEIFPSLRAAAVSIGGFEGDLSRAIKVGKLYRQQRFIYAVPDKSVEQQVKEYRPPVPTKETLGGRPVKNLTSGRVYHSVTEAAVCSGITPAAIRSSIKRKGKCSGEIWAYMESEEFRLLS